MLSNLGNLIIEETTLILDKDYQRESVQFLKSNQRRIYHRPGIADDSNWHFAVIFNLNILGVFINHKIIEIKKSTTSEPRYYEKTIINRVL